MLKRLQCGTCGNPLFEHTIYCRRCRTVYDIYTFEQIRKELIDQLRRSPLSDSESARLWEKGVRTKCARIEGTILFRELLRAVITGIAVLFLLSAFAFLTYGAYILHQKEFLSLALSLPALGLLLLGLWLLIGMIISGESIGEILCVFGFCGGYVALVALLFFPLVQARVTNSTRDLIDYRCARDLNQHRLDSARICIAKAAKNLEFLGAWPAFSVSREELKAFRERLDYLDLRLQALSRRATPQPTSLTDEFNVQRR